MKPARNHSSRAFTLVELFICVAVLAVAAAIFLPTICRRPRYGPHLINCTNNLKQIGLAFRTWALDNNDKFPMQVSVTNGGTMELVESGSVFQHFQVMSNELSTPKILFCPAESDAKRGMANKFATTAGAAWMVPLTNDNQISYFVGADADSKWPQMFLCGDRNLAVGSTPLSAGLHSISTNAALTWDQPRHDGAGNICFADGSVGQFHSRALRMGLRAAGVATNRLAMP
jgi:prepilin-type processing-associated H-X9-DG protein/prepilin-type N-terminal cleavage/methylation domain-containing protein